MSLSRFVQNKKNRVEYFNSILVIYFFIGKYRVIKKKGLSKIQNWTYDIQM